MTKVFWLVTQRTVFVVVGLRGRGLGGGAGGEEPCCLLLLWWQTGTLQPDGADGLGEWRAVIRGLQKRTMMLPVVKRLPNASVCKLQNGGRV